MTGAPSQPHHLHPDDEDLDIPDDLPPPSYEAARAAGAVPPPPPGQRPPATTTTTVANPQPQISTHDPLVTADSNPPYTPPPAPAAGGEGSAAWGVSDGNAIALQPVAQPPMSARGHQTPTPTQATSNSTRNPNSRNAKVVPLHLMNEKSEWVDCQFCKQRVRTKVVKKGKGFQCLTGTAFAVVCICLAPLPCCLHWFEQTQWFCGSCNELIAVSVRDAEIKVMPTQDQAAVPSAYATAGQAQAQQTGTQPAPAMMASSPQQHQSPILGSPQHSPITTQSPQAQHNHIPSLPPRERQSATPHIRVEDTQPGPAWHIQGDDQGESAQNASAQGSSQAAGRQPQTAAVISEGDRPPGSLPIKF